MSEDVKIVLSGKAIIRSEINTVTKGTLNADEPQTEFIIKFNKDVDADALVRATVFIIDEEGNYLRSEIKKVVPNKSFILKPLDKYDDEKPYYLVIAPKSKINQKHDRSIFVLFILKNGKIVDSRSLKSTDPRIMRILQSKDISQYAEKNVRIITEIDLASIKSGPCNKVVDNDLYGGSLYLINDRIIFKGLVSRAGEASKREEAYMLKDIKQILPTVVFNELAIAMHSGGVHIFRVNGRDAWIQEIKKMLETKNQKPEKH